MNVRPQWRIGFAFVGRSSSPSTLGPTWGVALALGFDTEETHPLTTTFCFYFCHEIIIAINSVYPGATEKPKEQTTRHTKEM